MINKLRRVFLAGSVFLASSLLLAGCGKAVLLNPKGPIASDERDLLITAVLLMLIIVLPVIVLTCVIAYRYRASNTSAKYDPKFHSLKLEITWWVLPIIIIAILGTITWISTHKLDPYKPIDSNVKPIKVQVISLQWRWLFIYPEQHIATMNFVEFPVNTPIDFEITSDAPMNSFVIQQLAGQIYSMAGMKTQLHLLASEKGDYRGLSVAFSGDGFSNMFFTAHVVDQAEFNEWVVKTQNVNNPLTLNSYNALALPSEDTKTMFFNVVDDALFDEVIKKYMGPDMGFGMGSNMPSMDMQKSSK